jgi:hypothetical protein
VKLLFCTAKTFNFSNFFPAKLFPYFHTFRMINNDLLGIKQITVDKVSSPNDFIVFTDDYYVPAENLTNISFSVKVAKIQI